MKSVLYVELANKQIDDKTMITTAKTIYTEAGNKAKDIKSLDVYVNAEELQMHLEGLEPPLKVPETSALSTEL